MQMKRICLLLLVVFMPILLTACGGGSGDGSSADRSTTDVGSAATSSYGGVVVDPYINGAILQEIAADGVTVLQRSSSASDAQGQFQFQDALKAGSIIEIKASSRGTHVGDNYPVILRRKVLPGASGNLVVSPLTTLVANGSTEEEVVDLLQSAGLTGFSASDINADPMAGLSNLTGGVTDANLSNLQAAIAVGNYLDAKNNQAVTATDLNNATEFMTLTSLLDAVQETLNAALFQDISTQLASDPSVSNLTLGDVIKAAVIQNRQVVALVKSQMANNGHLDQTAISNQAKIASNNMLNEAKTQNQASQGSSTPLDGSALYANNCSDCHGALASSSKSGRTASQIQSAIQNVGSMSFLSSLTTEEIQAIADALQAAPVVNPGTPPDGTTLYANNCAFCHGALDVTSKPGRTAAEIQAAIQNIGQMSSLSNLTTEEIQAIADVLPAAPVVTPGTPPDGAALYSSECSGCHGPLATTSKPGRTAAEIQAAIQSVGQMSSLSILTTEEIQAIADVLPAAPVVTPGTPPDGPTLYANNCASCHGALDVTTKPGRTAAQITAAIQSVGQMSSLSSLTADEVQAIADVLPAAPVVTPGTPPDGPTLYANNCASCHGALDATTKPGRTAAQITTAIQSVGQMNFLSTLTAEEIQAIADVLPINTGGGGPDYSDCTACHSQPPDGTAFPNTAGAHAAHRAISAIGTDCSICHLTAAHNGSVDLAFPSVYDGPNGPATDNLDGTCSNIRCHGGKTTPDWWSGSIDLTSQCTACHSTPSSGRHRDHRSRSCTDCHNSSRMATHIGDPATSTYEVSAASTIGGSGTRISSYSNGTCVGCHGSERW